MSNTVNRKLAVLDLETDPFSFGRVPRPFVSGFYDGSCFATNWHEDRCIELTVEMLAKRKEPLVIYAHNGGKFDWFYFLDSLTNRSNLRIINGRIVQAFLGMHEIRDSFAIMPFPLRTHKKVEIDYSKMERGRRDKHKEEIIEYLRVDCLSLYELVVAYWDEFGDVLTVGSAGLRELKKFHKFKSGNGYFDAKIRSNYYYGGRVEVFTPGIVKGPIKVLDVNSMYPYSMLNYLHPVGTAIEVSKYVRKKCCFVTAEGYSYGAFPVRTKTGIDFPWGFGTFHTSIHEWRVAEDARLFKCKRIVKAYEFSETTSFDEFVNHFYHAKIAAKVRGDKIHETFYKYILNSTYGKFAQDPANFKEYLITRLGEVPDVYCRCEGVCSCDGWHQEAIDNMSYMLWSKPLKSRKYFNIATAASITGASRSILLNGLTSANEVHYCDTDSIFAKGEGSLPLSDLELGSWKIEAEADSAAFCGKKLYALFAANGDCIKKAHKGIPSKRPGFEGITGNEIRKLATGELEYVTVSNDVPHFKLSGKHGFVTRKVRRTV